MWRINLVELAKVVCPFGGCHKSFRKPSQLKQHQRIHIGERPYVCPVDGCTKNYARVAHLIRHKEQSHAANDAQTTEHYVCEVEGCFQKFTAKQNLRKHERRVHEQSRVYLCSIEGCKERFSKRFELRHHTFQHKGVLPYQCNYDGCMKQFKQTSHLLRHVKSHEGYVCQVDGCCQKFDNWFLLRKHKAVDHKKVLQCDICQKTFVRPCLLRSHVRFVHPTDDTVEVYKCTESGCSRTYASVRSLRRHVVLIHEGQVTECPQCLRILSTKQKLQQHMKLHGPTEDRQQKKKPRLNTHRKKPFKKHVAELATVKDHGHITEEVTNTQPCDMNDVLSCKLTDQNKNSLKTTATDLNCNVAEPDGTLQT